MSDKAILKKRIAITKIIKRELSKAMIHGELETERAGEIASEVVGQIQKADSVEALDLAFERMIKDFSSLNHLGLHREELKKYDLDQEVADLVQELVEKGDFDKALSLANQVISVYIRNPDINIDDFKQELLKKWQSLTTKKKTKMHKTIEARKKDSAAPQSLQSKQENKKAKVVKKSIPPNEGQILQEEEVFSEPGKEEYHEAGEDIKAPELDTIGIQEKLVRFSEGAKKFKNLFTESSKEVSKEVASGSGSKIKDGLIKVLAKGQEVLENKKNK